MFPVHLPREPVPPVSWYSRVCISDHPIRTGSDDIPFRSDFEGDSSDFLGELAEFVHHGVDHILELYHDGPLDGNGDLLSEVAICDCLADSRDVLDLGL